MEGQYDGGNKASNGPVGYYDPYDVPADNPWFGAAALAEAGLAPHDGKQGTPG
jgi:hypothetical protein